MRWPEKTEIMTSLNIGVGHSTWKYVKFSKINDSFIPRPDINMEVIKSEYDALQLSLGKAVKKLPDYEKNMKSDQPV